MTRKERVAKSLENVLTGSWWTPTTINQLAGELLAIADDRTLLTLKDFSQRIGRNTTTIKSWQERGNVQVPEPAYRTTAGPLWDLQDVVQFCKDNPTQMGDGALGAGLDFI